jgi:NTE family protein
VAIQTKSVIGALGTDSSRGIAFGGGGEWFLAWMLGYALGMREQGVDLGKADVTIGTSAGSLVGTAVMSGHLWRLPHELEVLGKHPTLANKLLSISAGAPSQTRAIDAIANATSTDQESIQEIGRAAMAAHNAPADKYATSLHRMLGHDEWPKGHHVTAVDCYTGEPLIVSESDGIPIATACAASSSVAGINGPVWLEDRYCIDGGISSSSTHADALAGAKVVIILSMFDFLANPPKDSPGAFGIAERIHPGTANREAELLRSQGSTVHVAVANPDPTTKFMDAATILGGMDEGRRRGVLEAPALGAIWNHTE